MTKPASAPEPRLMLRALEPLDADFLYEAENDSSSWDYSLTVAPLSRRQLREYAENYDADPFHAGQIRLVVQPLDSAAPAGIADLFDISPKNRRAAVGIYILPESRGNNLASEAIALICDYASRHLHLNQLTAVTSTENAPAAKAFLKNGFTPLATLPQWVAKGSTGFSDATLFSKIL